MRESRLYGPDGQKILVQEEQTSPAPSTPPLSRQVARRLMRQQAQQELRHYHFGSRNGGPDPSQRQIKRTLARHAAATAWQMGDREIEGIKVVGDE